MYEYEEKEMMEKTSKRREKMGRKESS